MKKRMMRLLLELLKDSKRSDRELAKVLDVSQPTVSRMRSRLVKEGIIRDFTVMPDFVKMGYEIMAINCFKSKTSEEIAERAKKWVMSKPNIIFAAAAQGMGKNAVMISLHRNYTDFSNFLGEVLAEDENVMEDYDTMLISLEGRIVKPLSLKYLAEQET
ncbi:MAG: Lrp/AsnC family transcriptional regulator [Candidatus Bathyarchaeota archaeon]|nr:Lrp/AsnC family transcriptional regulator [Candidatus Bathyarchaeota archaeon]MDH5701387.1 Lrp/AsnC family transcriptional regulator [Candidatus Bathyarchaeota archaeon]